MTSEDKFASIAEKMLQAELPQVAIDTFQYYYRQLQEGSTGLIPEREIAAIESLPDADDFGEDLAEWGREAMDKVVNINLNGGLGTSMGLDKAKSLLEVKKGQSFLDIIAHQSLDSSVPLILMNSFATREDSLEELKKYKNFSEELPPDFVQHKVPKLVCEDLSAVEWPENPLLEWCPPGHGDIYTALVSSGMLEKMLAAGYQYAFVSNADNLGAYLDPRILGYFVKNNFPFMMEAADRTRADRKGGHLAIKAGTDQLILRESAQCPHEDEAEFQNIEKHKYFNTNSLWINLEALALLMSENNNVLGLPMIRNAKTVDPRDPDSTPVFQIETAMGTAIAVFKGATAIRVSRQRFAPVKTCDDLLAVRSDCTIIDDLHRIVPNPERSLGTIDIKLDPRYFKMVGDMEERFPYGPPSLIDCESLEVTGDVLFGKNIVIKRHVKIINNRSNQVKVADGTILTGDVSL